MEWEGLLGFTETQVWEDFADSPQRKIAVERARLNKPKIITQHGRTTDSRQYHRSVIEGLDINYEWSQWVNYRNLVEVLLFTFGDDTVTGSNPYTHSYSTEVSSNSLPSFSLFLDQGIGSSPTLNVNGCKVDELVLENTSSDILRATVRGAGQTHRNLAALSLSADDCDQFGLEPFIFSDLTFSIGLNGATRSVDQSIEGLTIHIRNNLIKRIPSSNTTLVIEPIEGMTEVTGSFSMELEDWAEFDAFIANQQVDLRFLWITGIYSLTITIQNARITVHPLPEARGGSGRGVVAIEFQGLYDDNDTVTAVLITDQAENVLQSSSSSSQSSSSSSSSSLSSSSSSSSSSSLSSSSSDSTNGIYADLNGSSMYFYRNDTDFPEASITGDMTIQAWIKPDDFDAHGAIVGKWDDSGNERSYFFRHTNDNELAFRASSDGGVGVIQATTGVNLVAGVWTHVAVVYDASEGTADFYKNGSFVEQETGFPTSIADTTSPFTVGGYILTGVLTAKYDGGIYRIDIFDDKRTAGEILSSYQDPLIDLSAAGNIIGSWIFDEDAVDTFIDNEQGDAGRDLVPYNGGDTTFGNCGRIAGSIPT